MTGQISSGRLFAAAIALLSVCFSSVQAQTQPPIWGGLKPGPYGVGFKTVTTYDYSRPGQRKYDYEGRFNSGERALPLLISVWYPAKANVGGARMSFEQYLYLSFMKRAFVELTPDEKLAAKKDLKAFFERPFNFPYGAVPQESWERLMQTRGFAVMNAEAAPGHFPLVAGTGGPLAHTTLDEYLASHGYVVARVMSPGEINLTGMQRTEFDVRNLEHLIGHLRAFPGVDRDRLGVIGMSAGGFPPYLLAMRNTEVDALVVMESALFYDRYASALKHTPWHDAGRLTAPYLHMYRKKESEASENLKDFEALRHSLRYRYLLHAENLLHQDFSNHGMAATYVLGIRGKDEPVAKLALETNWRYVLHFLNAHVKKDQSSLAFLRRKPEENGIPANFLTVEIKEAVKPAPSQSDFLSIIEQSGLPRAAQIYEEARKADPDAALFREEALISVGYRLLEGRKVGEAVGVFKLGVTSHPASARLYAGLSEAYAAESNKEMAVGSAEKSLALLAGDGGLADAVKARMKDSLTESVRRLKAQ
jgi:dienelactone hydrolase